LVFVFPVKSAKHFNSAVEGEHVKKE